MPELPEVETVRRGLEAATLDQSITGGEVLLARAIAGGLSSCDFLAALAGQSLTGWERRGKYLLGQLGNGGSLGVHLRMSGQLLWRSPPSPPCSHTRVRLFFASGHELRFVDQRTFGRMWWVPPGDRPEDIISGLSRLGPEPLEPGFSSDYLYEKLKSTHRPIKTALLDQGIVAGMGNIYADESLFLSGLHPQRIAASLTQTEVVILHQQICTVLDQGIQAGGTTIRNFVSPEGVNGHYSGQAWVYGRKGNPCRRCQSPIERLRLGGRSSHYCPQCQPPLSIHSQG